MAVRLYTHGYDLFIPCRPIAYHLWDRSYRKTFWELPESAALQSLSLLRIKVLLGMLSPEDVPAKAMVELSRYGLGDVRTLLQYENYAGVCFRDRRFLRPPHAWQPEPTGMRLHTHDEDRQDPSAP